MKLKRALTLAAPICLLVATVLPNAKACGDQIKPTRDAVEAEEVWNHDGWSIPGLAGSVLTKAAAPARNFSDTEGVDVAELSPGDEKTFRWTQYEMHPGTAGLEVKNSRYIQKIDRILRYEVTGHPFLYVVITETEVDCSKLKPGQTCGGVLGCGYTRFHYYDETGSGKFERMTVQTVGGPSPGPEALQKWREKFNHVPDWAKQLGVKGATPSQSSLLPQPRP